VYAQNLETSGASEVLADGERVRLTWRPQHSFLISPPEANNGDGTSIDRIEEESER
jgi:hypothetical protein